VKEPREFYIRIFPKLHGYGLEARFVNDFTLNKDEEFGDDRVEKVISHSAYQALQKELALVRKEQLYEAILKAWPNTTFSIAESVLPDMPLANITMLRDDVKKFNAQFLEMGEFIALVLGVEMKKLCRADMLKYLAVETDKMKQLENENDRLRAALEAINKAELNAQRPGGGYSVSAKISYEALNNKTK